MADVASLDRDPVAEHAHDALDPDEMPFSRAGAFTSLSRVLAPAIRHEDVHLVSHRGPVHAPLRLTVLAPATALRADTTLSMRPAVLAWVADEGTVEAVYADASTVRLRGRGVALRIADADAGARLTRDIATGAATFVSGTSGRRYRVSVGAGALTEHPVERAVVIGPAAGGEWELALEEIATAHAARTFDTGFADDIVAVDSEFHAFLDAVAPWRFGVAPAALRAAYVMWSAVVGAEGAFHRDTMLMSKNWMDRVWSWDHCFNALALAPGLPGLAVDQFRTAFDHQDPSSGALPDLVGYTGAHYDYVKPPVHGWAVERLLDRLDTPGRAAIAEMAEPLARLTRFWLDLRRVPGTALPVYQHGNDSGWDNCTVFDGGHEVVSADLAAMLVRQMRLLARLARERGDETEAAGWDAQATKTATAMVDELWVDHPGEDGAFVVRDAWSATPRPTTSLLGVIPVIAHADLPDDVVRALVRRAARFVTDWGIATELPESPDYTADGYWRGPVWAPSTHLVVDALEEIGEHELAIRIARGYLRACERSGFAENFDALTGAGLRDRAYTWTAASYLVLAERYGGTEART